MSRLQTRPANEWEALAVLIGELRRSTDGHICDGDAVRSVRTALRLYESTMKQMRHEAAVADGLAVCMSCREETYAQGSGCFTCGFDQPTTAIALARN